MRKKAKITNRKQPSNIHIEKAVWIILPSVIGLIISLILSSLMALLMSKSTALPTNTGLYLTLSVLPGAFASGLIATRKTGLKGVIAGLLTALFYTVFIFSVMLIFSNGQLTSKTLPLFAGCLLCSVFGGIAGANMKRRK